MKVGQYISANSHLVSKEYSQVLRVLPSSPFDSPLCYSEVILTFKTFRSYKTWLQRAPSKWWRFQSAMNLAKGLGISLLPLRPPPSLQRASRTLFKPIYSFFIASYLQFDRQVHRAFTKDGREVAVKVQYPEVSRNFNGDMFTHLVMLRLVQLVPSLYLIQNCEFAC